MTPAFAKSKGLTRTIQIVKLNAQQEEAWRYAGKVIEADEEKFVVEAYFDRPDSLFHGLLMKTGDRFVETYFFDRWYNIFEIYDRDELHLKGWYCNITRPAELRQNNLYYVDLALDLLVFPDGRTIVLDEDEFVNLSIDEPTKVKARLALNELQRWFKEKIPGGS